MTGETKRNYLDPHMLFCYEKLRRSITSLATFFIAKCVQILELTFIVVQKTSEWSALICPQYIWSCILKMRTYTYQSRSLKKMLTHRYVSLEDQ